MKPSFDKNVKKELDVHILQFNNLQLVHALENMPFLHKNMQWKIHSLNIHQ